MIAGYDPHRIAALQLRTRWALGDLDGIVSTDAAATGAMVALRRLRTVLTSEFVPAIAAIRTTDPLVAGSDWYDNWLGEQLGRIDRTRHSQLTDVDLATLLHIELTRQIEENGAPDTDDPFWTDPFAEWVAELERRMRIDPDFAAFLVDEAATNPIIGYIVAAGRFDADILAAVTAALTETPPSGAVHDTYRDGAVAALLTTISDRPAVALTLLGEPEMVETLLTWNDRHRSALGIGGETIGALFGSALGHPFSEPSRLDEGREVLRRLVALTHGPLFDRGLPPGTATGITAGLIGYLPSLVASLGLDHAVYFQAPDGTLTALLGAADEVVDLVGALLRDSTSQAMLIATIPALAIGSSSGPYDLDAVNDYVKTLVEAADTERIEEEIHTRRTKDQWNQVIGVVSSILEAASKVGGKKFAIAHDVIDLVEVGARWLVEQIDADDLGMNEVQSTAFLLLVYGVSVAFLDERRAGGAVDDDDGGHDDDDPRIDEARGLADEISRLLDDGGSRSEVERQILNLRAVIEKIGGDDTMRSLDDPRIAPPEYDAGTDAAVAD